MTAQLSKSHRQSEAKADPRLPDEGSAKAAAGSKKASDIPDPVSLGIKTDPKSAKTKTKPEAEKKKRKPKTFDLDAYSEIMIKRNGARAPH